LPAIAAGIAQQKYRCIHGKDVETDWAFCAPPSAKKPVEDGSLFQVEFWPRSATASLAKEPAAPVPLHEQAVPLKATRCAEITTSYTASVIGQTVQDLVFRSGRLDLWGAGRDRASRHAAAPAPPLPLPPLPRHHGTG
jgi:hypothetical protein